MRSVPGVGKQLSLTLLAHLPELGSLDRKRIAALVGVALINRDSGQMRGKRSVWGGRTRVRAVLYMGALVGSRYNPALQSLYQRLLTAGNTAGSPGTDFGQSLRPGPDAAEAADETGTAALRAAQTDGGAGVRADQAGTRPPAVPVAEPGADGRHAQGPLRDHRAADGAGPGCPAAITASSLQRRRQTGGPGEFAVPGPVQDQRLLGSGGRRPPGRLGQGYVDQVFISCGSEIITRYPRSYGRDDFVYDPIHYLPLLEQRIGALDQAAPPQGWDLPEEFSILRRRGKREFVQVLRLVETFSRQEVHSAVEDALRLGAISFHG